MDDDRFDRLARSLLGSRSRRRAAGMIGALAALPLLAPGPGAARKKHKKGKKGKGKKTPTTLSPTTTPRPCTLRPADNLQAAIDAAVAGSTLALCAGTWNIANNLRIEKNLTLSGTGIGQTILDGGKVARVLIITPNSTVFLQDLTITRGNGDDSFGGGILTNGDLPLQRVVVSDSTSDFGGGIYVGAANLLLMAGSQVTGNSVKQNNNPAGGGLGGGIFNRDGTVRLMAGSSVTGNKATAAGGGIGTSSASAVTLDAGSIVTGNTGRNDAPDNCAPDIGACT